MKHIATMTLMLTLGVAAVYAQEKPVKMTFSGNEPDQSKPAQHKYRRGECRRERYAAPVHLSKCHSYRNFSFSAAAQHLLGPKSGLLSKSGRRGHISLPRWESIGGQSHARRWR